MESVIQKIDGHTSIPPPPRTIAQGTRATYTLLPRRLMEDQRTSHVAIGVYALVARMYRATKSPVPLSPGDLASFDLSLTSGSGTRALRRLVETGYLLPVDSGGRKHAYIPTWGQVHETPVPWDLTAPAFGRPRHIAAIRLEDRLLDLLIGRLRPCPSHPAIIERYLTAPQLTLRAVGAYSLSLIHIPTTCPPLRTLGLLDDAGHPLPIPDEETLLAIASQRAASMAMPGGLTPAGRKRVGIAPPPAPPATGQPLFFVPEGQIAHPFSHMIGDLIGCASMQGQAISAPESHASPMQPDGQGSYGKTGCEGNQPPPDSTSMPNGAPGGGKPIAKPRGRIIPNAQAPAAQIEGNETSAVASSDDTSESARLLQGIGVRADVARCLAAHDSGQITRLINQARSRPEVRDVAGWVVSALRALPTTQEVPAPPLKVSEAAILFHPTLSGFDRQRWLARFRRADPADRPTILARFHAEHPLEEHDVSVT